MGFWMRQELKLFEDLEQELRDEINRYAKLIQFAKGEILFGEDQLSRYFYIMIDGRIKSYQINFKNNKEQTLFLYTRGDMFDTIILLDEKVHDVMYKVLDDATLLQLPIEKVRHWLYHNPSFNRKFFPYIASQMRHIENLATDISLYNTSERLTKLILENIDNSEPHEPNLLQDLSNTEIANLIGTVRHVVERHFKTLKEEGIIEGSDEHKLSVKNMQKLLEKHT